jgi:hypothetical protein
MSCPRLLLGRSLLISGVLLPLLSSKYYFQNTSVLSLVFFVPLVDEHTLGLGGQGGLGLRSRRHSVLEPGCIIQAICQIVYSSSSSAVMSSWKVSGKFVLMRLIFALLFPVKNADAFFFALWGAFSLYALTWWTCAAIQQTLSPIQWPKVLQASHCTSFLYLNGERCPFRLLFPLPFPLPPNLPLSSPNLLITGDCGMIGMCWLLFVANVLMRLFMRNSAGRLAQVVV